MKVIIDAGHGGSDPGAMGHVIEKEVNLAIALALKYVLVKNDIDVSYTRYEDTFVSLQERYQIANEMGADLFVSIHCNGADSEEAQGSETYYYKNKDKLLAEKLNQGITKVLGTKDRGVKHGKFAVIRKTTMPAVLLELAFVSNQEDGKRLKDLLENRELRLELVNNLAKAIVYYKKPMGVIKRLYRYLKKK